MGKIPLSALDKAMKLLSVRALSKAELTRKLHTAGYPEDEVEEAVNTCCRLHYIDDTQLAADYTGLLRMRNTGSRVIRQKLIKRGLGGEIVERQLPEEDSETADTEAARRALDYKWRLLVKESDPRKKREKAFRYLAGKGFPSGVIFKLISEQEQTENELY